jgi:hypothetical protein
MDLHGSEQALVQEAVEHSGLRGLVDHSEFPGA